MTTVIRHASAADLLAMVPNLVGLVPHHSLVLIAFRGKLTYAAMRFDLPRSATATVVKRYVTTVLGPFCKIRGVDGVVPVVISDNACEPRSPLMQTLVRRLGQSGFEVRDALSQGNDGWASYYDPSVHPLEDITAAASRHALVAPAATPSRVPEADEVSRRRMRHELDELAKRVAEFEALDVDHLDPGDPLSPLVDIPLLAEGALKWDSDAIEARGALLLFALQGPPVRDLVMLQWAFGLEFGDAMWSSDLGTPSPVDEESAMRMMGHGPRPHVSRVLTAIALLTTLVSRVEGELRRAPLCMLAWLNWALGHGSTAGDHIDEARTIDPTYGMAELLDTMFSNGMMPEWAFDSGL